MQSTVVIVTCSDCGKPLPESEARVIDRATDYFNCPPCAEARACVGWKAYYAEAGIRYEIPEHVAASMRERDAQPPQKPLTRCNPVTGRQEMYCHNHWWQGDYCYYGAHALEGRS